MHGAATIEITEGLLWSAGRRQIYLKLQHSSLHCQVGEVFDTLIVGGSLI